MINVQVMNIAGQLVISASQATQLDLSELENGMYVLRDDHGRIARILKQ